MYGGSSTPPALPVDMVPGMSGGSYNPETGQRTSFALPPSPRPSPPDQFGADSIDWNAVQDNIQNHGVEQALKATEAAIQFQGQRRYQQLLKDGKTPAEAITAAGPMMFYHTPQAFAPSVRALAAPPGITAQQAEQNAIAREKLAEVKRNNDARLRATRSASPGSVVYDEVGNVKFIVPEGGQKNDYTETKQDIPIPGIPEKSHVVPGMFGQTWGPFGTKVIDAPAVPESVKHSVTRTPNSAPSVVFPGMPQGYVPPKAFQSPAVTNQTAAPDTPTSPKVNEVIKIAPNGKRAVFDADTKKFVRYAD